MRPEVIVETHFLSLGMVGFLEAAQNLMVNLHFLLLVPAPGRRRRFCPPTSTTLLIFLHHLSRLLSPLSTQWHVYKIKLIFTQADFKPKIFILHILTNYCEPENIQLPTI